MSLEDDARRGEAAKALLENEGYINSWTGAFASLVNDWTNSDVEDSEYREVLFRRLQGLKQARELVENMIENGKRAEHEIERARKHGNE